MGTAQSRTLRSFAAVVIAVVAAGLGILAWAFIELQRAYGPSYGVRLGDGRLVLASHGYLHVFDAERRVARVDLKDLGLGRMVADLDALADGTLLVADSDSKTLRLCRLEARRCSVFYDGATHPDGQPRRAFKAAIEPDTGRVVLSDSSNHRLLLVDAAGRLQQATPTHGPRFTFPNGISFLEDGRLAVADTDRLRIAFLKVESQGFASDETDLRTRRVFPGSDVFHPLDVVADASGRLWAILASNSLQTGAVVAMQPDGSKPHHVALPSPADPLSLVVLDGAILVLEPSTYRVSRVALHDGAVTRFGERAFIDELQREATWRSLVLGARQAAQVLLVVGLVAALIIAVLSRTMRVLPQLRPKWQIPAAPAPLAGRTDWIEANPLPGRAMLIAYGAVAVLGFGGFYLYLQSVVKARPEEWFRLELLLTLLILIAVLALVVAYRHSRGRLGTDGQALFVEDAGRKVQAPLAEVLYSNTRLLVGPIVVWLRLPAGDRYPSERIAASILARLPESAKLSEWRLNAAYFVRSWRRIWSRA